MPVFRRAAEPKSMPYPDEREKCAGPSNPVQRRPLPVPKPVLTQPPLSLTIPPVVVGVSIPQAEMTCQVPHSTLDARGGTCRYRGTCTCGRVASHGADSAACVCVCHFFFTRCQRWPGVTTSRCIHLEYHPCSDDGARDSSGCASTRACHIFAGAGRRSWRSRKVRSVSE